MGIYIFETKEEEMSNRQDQEREAELQPSRMVYAKNSLIMMGFHICQETETWLEFVYDGSIIKFFPYSGWHTGKSIRDGRGLQNLLKQLK